MSDKSPFFVEAKPLTRLDTLRTWLDQLESLIGRLEKIGLGARALEIPDLFDQADTALKELERDEQSLPEETARFETVGAQLKGKATLFLRTIGGPQALRAARQAKDPGPERWWWFLDEWVAGVRRQQARRIALRALSAAAILTLLVVVYQAFLAPSPAEQARYSYESAADRFLLEGNLQAALTEIENALVVAPGDAELLLLKGVILQALGQEAEAALIFTQAEAAFGDNKLFYLSRGQDYMNLGNIHSAMEDANTVLQIDPQSPEAYLLLGQAHELQEQYLEAMAAYEQASSLASEHNRPEIAALARIRLAYLMQRMPAGSP